MAVSRRDFIRGGVSAFTIGFAAPAFLSDLARAQGVRARNLVIVYLGGGNDALSTVVPYQDSVLLQPAPEHLYSGGAGAADWRGLERQGARAAPAPGRPAGSVQLRSPGDRAADRLSELEPIALSRERHLGYRQSHAHRERRLAGSLPRDGSRRSAFGLEHDAGTAAGADVARGQRAVDPERGRLCVLELQRRRSRERTRDGHAHRVACADRTDRIWRS